MIKILPFLGFFCGHFPCKCFTQVQFGIKAVSSCKGNLCFFGFALGIIHTWRKLHYPASYPHPLGIRSKKRQQFWDEIQANP